MNSAVLQWNRIDVVLLDMDGTLLDLKFDNDFWLQAVPGAYASRHDLTYEQACQVLFPKMRALRGTLDWYCIEFWSEELGLDIAALKRDRKHLISLREGATRFLSAVRQSGRRQLLVTNAHEVTLDIKMEVTGIGHLFDELITSHQFNAPKEQDAFWQRLSQHAELDLSRCLFIDDSLSVIEAARRCGVGQVLSVAKPDSSRAENEHDGYHMLDSWDDVMP
mgnify:CR=1 FL=1